MKPFFGLKITNADGRCINAIVSTVNNMPPLWDAPVRYAWLIRIYICLSKLIVWLLLAFEVREPNRNSYLNWNFVKSRIPSLFKSVFWVMRVLIFLTPVLVLILRVHLSRHLLLCILRFLLVTVICPSSYTCTSTSSTSHNRTSTTCTFNKVKLWDKQSHCQVW